LIIDLIDTKVLVLDKLLSKLKTLAMDSVNAYVISLLRDFIIAYVVFVIVLTFSLFFMLYWFLAVIKRNMWDTNIILKILPYETLPREEREEIKSFF
jgi:hypothetical protein